jgi:hypothetical protein
MHNVVRRLAALSPAIFLGVGACLPYTVGSTARTVPTNETTVNTSWYFIPNAYRLPGDTIATPLAGTDVEVRHGLGPRADLGLRLLPGGVMIDYKQRLDSDPTATGTAVSIMGGGGIVNGGEHFMLQGTLVVSGREDAALVPFGGLRAIQVLPISYGAVSDRPTIGAFGGLQFGDRSFTVRPELGVFYDHSALGIRRGDVIIVPAVTIQRRRREEDVRLRGHGPVWTGRGVREPVAPGGDCRIGSCASPGAPARPAPGAGGAGRRWP